MNHDDPKEAIATIAIHELSVMSGGKCTANQHDEDCPLNMTPMYIDMHLGMMEYKFGVNGVPGDKG
jgi:hypothetical protein